MNSEGYIVLLLCSAILLAPAVITQLRVIVAAFGKTDGFPTRGAVPQFAIAGARMGTLTARHTATRFIFPLSLLDLAGLGQPALLVQLLRPVLGKASKAGVSIVLVNREASHF